MMERQVLPISPTRTVHEGSEPEELVAWSIERFMDRSMVITTSFGMEGCVLIDMYAAHNVPMTVAYLDTMFFFPETYALRDQMVERYPQFTFVNRGTAVTLEEQEKEHGPALWAHDPDRCCKLRKVEPMGRALAGIDVCITGLRRSQSPTRANLRTVDWDWKHQLLKISPLAGWDREQVWNYVTTHNVPYNALHERGYPTVGCTHCTKPIPGSKIGQYSRSGRWAGHKKTECGLHGDGI